jgi:hypothetical protein
MRGASAKGAAVRAGDVLARAEIALDSEHSASGAGGWDETSASIFISYAHADREHADRLASRLSAVGYSVWWDRHIRTGRHFDQVIETAHAMARLVIVLWSKHSVSSDWVRAEASRALEDNKLLPVKIDEVRPPLRFAQIQAANLVGWDGSADTAGLAALLHEVREQLGPPENALGASANSTPQILDQPKPGHRFHFAFMLRLAVTMSVLAGVGMLTVDWYVSSHRSGVPSQVASPAPQSAPQPPNRGQRQPPGRSAR